MNWNQTRYTITFTLADYWVPLVSTHQRTVYESAFYKKAVSPSITIDRRNSKLTKVIKIRDNLVCVNCWPKHSGTIRDWCRNMQERIIMNKLFVRPDQIVSFNAHTTNSCFLDAGATKQAETTNDSRSTSGKLNFLKDLTQKLNTFMKNTKEAWFCFNLYRNHFLNQCALTI